MTDILQEHNPWDKNGLWKHELRRVRDLHPNPKNPRTITEQSLKGLRESLKDNGYTMRLIVDSHNKILSGHARWIIMNQDDPDAVIEVLVAQRELTEQEEKDAILGHNVLGGSWDIESAQMNFDPIDWQKFDLTFDIDDLPGAETKIEEDEIPETAPQICKKGDVWKLGNHRLMCGDSTNADDVAKLMNGEKVDLLFTDPPYGMNLDTDYSSMKNRLDFAKEKKFTGGKKYAQGIVDDFNPKMISLILSLNIKEVFLWGADYYAELLPNKNDGSWIVWDKRANNTDDINADESSDKMYGSCFELCWSKNKHKRDIARIKWAGVFGTEKEFDHKRYHPTQKPTALVQWFLDKYSKDGQRILDLFGGSGSTLIACEQLNRKCFMMELDPHYCDVIIARWEKLTGKTAEKEENER